jgi:hypothetical protein
LPAYLQRRQALPDEALAQSGSANLPFRDKFPNQAASSFVRKMPDSFFL